MTKAVSIHIGVDILDPGYYQNTELRNLKSCKNDAKVMREIAISQNFSAEPILADATIEQVTTNIKEVAGSLSGGDICLITFSGHGTQITDDDREERYDHRFLDEIWCLKDGFLLDDTLVNLWTMFNPGVRILVISDSCHSGGIIDVFNILHNTEISALLERGFDFRSFIYQTHYETNEFSINFPTNNWEANSKIIQEVIEMRPGQNAFSEFKRNLLQQRLKEIPKPVAEYLHYVKNYDSDKHLIETARAELDQKMVATGINNIRDLEKASLILISACQDYQKTRDGLSETDNGDFTKALNQVWTGNGNSFAGNYQAFTKEIHLVLKSMNRTQTPNYYLKGTRNPIFEAQSPFQIIPSPIT